MTNSELQKRIDLLENRIKKLEESQEPQHHEFKVGDRVQFKSWEEMEKEFGLTDYNGKPYINVCPCFTKDMRYLCGEFATICEIQNAGFVLLKDFSIKNKDNISYSYSLDMLNPATDEPKCKFKVGNKVKINDEYDFELHNQIATICKTCPDNVPPSYLVDFDDKKLGMVWVNEMILEPYTEPRWTFTDDEKVILRNLPEGYKWIARDAAGRLFVYYNIIPHKDEDFKTWTNTDGYFAIMSVFKHIFQSIKWSDDEPCEFRKFL